MSTIYFSNKKCKKIKLFLYSFFFHIINHYPNTTIIRDIIDKIWLILLNGSNLFFWYHILKFYTYYL